MSLYKRVETSPLPLKPYSLSNSGLFEGDDGLWSTFFINIGDSDGTGSGQNFRILPSTSSPTTLIPRQAEWCTNDCPKLRGIGLVDGRQPEGVVNSRTWQEKTILEMPTPWGWSAARMTDTWNSTPAGLLGTDNLGLGESSAQSPVLTQQYMMQYTVKDFFLGSLGLAAGAFGPQGASIPNFINNFYASTIPYIASRSYGYTAGAYYRNNNNGIPGSLVFGGYDKSRMVGPGLSVNMPSDRVNTLAIGVQSITWRPDQDKEANQVSLTINSDAFAAIIDSTLPYMILPDAICEELGTKFQATYDQDLNIYTVNSSAHEQNANEGASIVFSLSPGVKNNANFTAITLPYAALDHNLSSPIADPPIRYLPIKRSEDGTYVLGRTFLQEAYLIVDYERTNFTIAPAYAPSSDDIGTPNLVTIFNTTVHLDESQGANTNKGLSSGAIAGIAIGIVLAFIIVGVGAFFYWRRKKGAKQQNQDSVEEKPGDIDTAYAGTEVKHRRVSELAGSESHQSTDGHSSGYYGDPKLIPTISEMSPESSPAELYSPAGDGERRTFDYFANDKAIRRVATRAGDSSGQSSPRTPIAELPANDIRQLPVEHRSGAKHARGVSDTSLSANIDGVLAGEERPEPQEQHTAMRSTDPASPIAISHATDVAREHGESSAFDRRPSHTRGPSDTTIQSDSTAVSQPTQEELDRWARNAADNDPPRPMSP